MNLKPVDIESLPQVEPITTVWQTKDYGLFKKMPKNRIVTEARIKTLLESLGEKAINTPIICNEYLEIAEGQGRFEARKKMGLPITFIIEQGLTFEDCVRLNKANTKWELDDYVDSYAQDENLDIAKNYKELKKCAKENEISLGKTIRLAGISMKDSGVRDGKLKFTQKETEAVSDLIKKGHEVTAALCFTQRLNDAFWISMKVALRTDGYDHQRFVRNATACRTTYHQMSNIEAELKEFSRIYNYRTKSKDAKIYFEDYMRNKGHNVRNYEFGVVEHADVSTLQENR